MTAQYVTVILDRVTADGAQVASGSELVAPSMEFPDAIGLVEPGALEREYGAFGPPKVKLLANDTAGPQQDSGDPGWSYVFTPVDVDGAETLTLWVLSTGGPVQNLSDLATAPVAQPGAQYLAKPSQPGTPGQVLTIGDDGAPEWDDEAAANAVPIAQTFPLANNTYKPIYEWTVTGQTDDPLPSFGLIAGSQTYGYPHSNPVETVQGPAFWFGINPRHLSNMVPSSPRAALGISAFMDAGDTYNPSPPGGVGSGHGLEFNIAWVSPTEAKAVAPIEVVGADDETRTVTLALRCGDGQFARSDGGMYVSGITMSDAAGNAYLTAGPFNNSAYGAVAAGTAPGVAIGAPLALTTLPYLFGSSAAKMQVLFNAAGAAGNGSLSWSAISNSDSMTALWEGSTSALSTVYAVAGPATSAVTSGAGPATFTLTAAGSNNAAKFQAVSGGGTAQFILNGNTTVSSQMVFQKNGANTWVMQDSGGSSLYLTNNSGNPQMLLTSGTNTAGNYDNATSFLTSKVVVYGSLAVTNGGSALAVTATKGFLYLPAVAGTPTGTPVANAGSVPVAWDTTGGKLWAYQGGAWTAVGGAAGALLAANNLSDLANAATARTNLGLGTAATQPSTAFDAAGAAAAAQAASDPSGSAATAQSAAETYANATFVPWSLLGQPNGVASLDAGGLLPAAQLPAGIAPSLAIVASTGLTGYTLVNGTGTILSWTAPNDGQMHRVQVIGCLHVTSAETGGTITGTFTNPDGSASGFQQVASSSQGAGVHPFPAFTVTVKPGTTFTLNQASALTAGAALLWAELWAL